MNPFGLDRFSFFNTYDSQVWYFDGVGDFLHIPFTALDLTLSSSKWPSCTLLHVLPFPTTSITKGSSLFTDTSGSAATAHPLVLKEDPIPCLAKKGFRSCSFPMIGITCHRLQLLILSQGLHFFFHILQREENTK
jgi:hypothetical protein